MSPTSQTPSKPETIQPTASNAPNVQKPPDQSESLENQSLASESLESESLDGTPAGDTSNTAANQLKPIYFISGLGADERIFRWLRCDGFQPKHIHWLDPARGESLESYATRLAEQIEDEQPIVVGLSFGGIIAVEIAKQIDTAKVILLSSTKTASEVPFYFKLFRALPIHRIFPFKSLLWGFLWLAYWLFAPEGTDQRLLFKTILVETDARFLKWALHKVVTWNNQHVPETVVHIHGKRDRIFPYRFVTPDYAVERSGHLMVMNRAAEISDLLDKVIVSTECSVKAKN
ncbi:MAG: alpha/beta hydrolase [Cyanobacteria bacterium J06623_5]